MKTLVIIPTYDEHENVASLIPKVTSQNDQFHVLVVDDNSPDGTAGIVRELAKADPRISLICRPVKQGLGTAYITGFKFALSNDFECIVEMDADFSHDPSVLESLVRTSLAYDVVVGSRYIPGGTIENWSWFRRQLSRRANELARFLLGRAIHDWTSGYRCYRRHVLKKLPLDRIHSTGYAFQIEMLDACLRLGCQIAEVPITFSDRRSGRSKLSHLEIYQGVFTLLRLGAKRLLFPLGPGL